MNNHYSAIMQIMLRDQKPNKRFIILVVLRRSV